MDNAIFWEYPLIGEWIVEWIIDICLEGNILIMQDGIGGASEGRYSVMYGDNLAASLMFAVFSTMQGLFPPSSRVTGVRCSDADFITSFPTPILPVKKI